MHLPTSEPSVCLEMGRVEKVAELFNTPQPAEGFEASAQIVSRSEVIDRELNAISVLVVEKVGEFFNTSSAEALSPASPLPAPAPVSAAGRPRSLTPELEQQLCLLLQAGLSRRQAAAYVHLDPSTITKAIARDPDFAANLARAEELSLVQTHLCVLTESRRNWRAAAWLLEQRRKHPAPLTKEDKEIRHQERMADLERDQEYHLRKSVLTLEEMTTAVTGKMPERIAPPLPPPPSRRKQK